MVLTQVLCNGNVMYYQKQQILHINIKIVFTSFYFYIVDSNIFDFTLQYFILPPLRLIIEVMRLSMDMQNSFVYNINRYPPDSFNYSLFKLFV